MRQALLMQAYRRGLAAHGQRLVRFGLVGLAGAGVNMAILYLLVAHGRWNHLVAVAMATEAAIVSNFLLNDRWTFSDALPGLAWLHRLARYNLIALGGLALSLLVVAVLTLVAGLHYLAANLVAIGAGTLWNYVVNARWTWRTLRISAPVGPLAAVAGTAGLPVQRRSEPGAAVAEGEGERWTYSA